MMSDHSLISFDLDEKDMNGTSSPDITQQFNQLGTASTTHIFLARNEDLQKKWYCLIKWVIDLYN